MNRSLCNNPWFTGTTCTGRFTIEFMSYVSTAEQQKERKKEMARRLLEINARKREEKLAEDEEQLSQLLTIQVGTYY